MTEASTDAVQTAAADEAAAATAAAADEAAAAAAAADEAGADDEKTGDDEAAAAAAAAAAASDDQITYADFEMEEGLELDTDALALATPLFNELGLDQAGAQKLVSLQSDLIQAGAKKQLDAFNDQVATWREDAKKDSEFGGDSFDENVKLAQSAVNKFGTPELKQLLEDYGVGNHPEIIRFMVKVGKLTAEDVPGNSGSATGAASDHVSILYPNAKKS